MADLRWTVRVDSELAAQVALLAEMEGTSIQRMVVDAMRARVEAAAADPAVREHARAKVAAMAKAYGIEDSSDNTGG